MELKKGCRKRRGNEEEDKNGNKIKDRKPKKRVEEDQR